MSAIENIPEGYELCDCHPETCCHFDGLKYVGNKSNSDRAVVIPKIAEKIRAITTIIWSDISAEKFDDENYLTVCECEDLFKRKLKEKLSNFTV